MFKVINGSTVAVNFQITFPKPMCSFAVRAVLFWRKLFCGHAYRRIPLSRGKYAKVDVEDYERLARYNWYAKKSHGTFYAVRTEKNKGRSKSRIMHREIMGEAEGFVVDHINHDGLDNRRANLRLATRSQNQWNIPKNSRIKSTSKYKGVRKRRISKPFSADITVEGRKIHLGDFAEEVEAARAYDEAAKKYFGEFACLNFSGGKRGLSFSLRR